MTTTPEWVSAYAEAAGIAPANHDDIDVLLQLAAIAAHASRTHRRTDYLLDRRHRRPHPRPGARSPSRWRPT